MSDDQGDAGRPRTETIELEHAGGAVASPRRRRTRTNSVVDVAMDTAIMMGLGLQAQLGIRKFSTKTNRPVQVRQASTRTQGWITIVCYCVSFSLFILALCRPKSKHA